jgi:serine/threonine protein kinase
VAFDRDVALKFLAERYPPHSVAAKRFLDEARITARLQHPAIPPVHHIGALLDGRPFLAMKLIKGKTLADQLARRSNIRPEPATAGAGGQTGGLMPSAARVARHTIFAATVAARSWFRSAYT